MGFDSFSVQMSINRLMCMLYATHTHTHTHTRQIHGNQKANDELSTQPTNKWKNKSNAIMRKEWAKLVT